MTSTLLIGFDSAWTPTNSGAIIGVLRREDGTFCEPGPPRIADFREAENVICAWQAFYSPTTTIILLDQPTIVENSSGQRPVENIVGSPVSLRYGGVQPASTSRNEMFGADAPVWSFLERFGGPANPLRSITGTRVIETYPVLALIALRWILAGARITGRLPKYNPQRRKTFSIQDWQYVCRMAAVTFRGRGLIEIAIWLETIGRNSCPRKSDQDCLDACLCLLTAVHLAEGEDCLMVGDLRSGYIVVPGDTGLRAELEARCRSTNRVPEDWVRVFRLGGDA